MRYCRGVAYAIVLSRNNWKQKDARSPRPRFHVYFLIHPVEDAESYSNLKKRIHKRFSFFDGNALDADGDLLNTPAGTCYLPDGVAGMREKLASDLITKQTVASPGMDGRQLWEDALEMFFCGDKELIEYVQMVVGMASIGRVCMEALIIAFGGGRNGSPLSGIPYPVCLEHTAAVFRRMR